jgi:hypothetical protein
LGDECGFFLILVIQSPWGLMCWPAFPRSSKRLSV